MKIVIFLFVCLFIGAVLVAIFGCLRKATSPKEVIRYFKEYM